MNNQQKLVQQEFLNNEQEIIKRLNSMYQDSLSDIETAIKGYYADIQRLTDAINDLDPNDPQRAILESQRRSKVYQKQYQETLKAQVSEILDKMNTKQYLSVSDYLNDCYTNGFVGAMYDLHGQGIPLMLPIDQQAMVRAVQLDSKISKGLYTKMGIDVGDLKNRITSTVSRAMATGLSFERCAKDLANQTKIGFNKAVRIARTEGHRIQTTATMDAMTAAKDNGADVLKQWDATLDGNTRESHAMVDGEIRELHQKFSNGLDYPGSGGKASEVVNCRCALLQRARWALDDDELKTLQERAKYFGLDKTQNFDDFKQKYLGATAPSAKPKKEYLTKKKLEEKIADIEKQLASTTDPAKLQALADEKAMYQQKLDEKIVVAETKKLKKEQIKLQDELDNFDIKTYKNIWKDDVTTKDWAAKQGAIQAKKNYFEQKLLYATDQAERDKWQKLLDDLDEFDKTGAEYYKIQSKLEKTKKSLTNLQNNGKMSSADSDAYSQARKDAAHWYTDKNGGGKAADQAYRPKSGEVWRAATTTEKDAIFEYTRSYSKFNEPLRGIEYGTNKFLGVGNVDLDTIGMSYSGFKRGEVKQKIDAMTSIIEKSSYDDDIWLQRGCRLSGMDKFFGIDSKDFYLPESELAAKLLGTEPIEYAFMSTGVAKGKGLNIHGGVLMNIYAPKGTKMMYVEPFSSFGNGAGRSWDGFSTQSSVGGEAEMILQRGTQFRVIKVEKSNGIIYIDLEVIRQGVS